MTARESQSTEHPSTGQGRCHTVGIASVLRGRPSQEVALSMQSGTFAFAGERAPVASSGCTGSLPVRTKSARQRRGSRFMPDRMARSGRSPLKRPAAWTGGRLVPKRAVDVEGDHGAHPQAAPGRKRAVERATPGGALVLPAAVEDLVGAVELPRQAAAMFLEMSRWGSAWGSCPRTRAATLLLRWWVGSILQEN
jgi:hypothetical protein